MSKLLNSLKKKALELSATAYVNHKIRNFGSVKRLEIDSESSRLLIEVNLAGEAAPVTVQVGAYELVRDNENSFITLRQIQCSKEWLAIALNEFLAEQKLKIPNALGTALSGKA
jgi:hypothetical protein